MYQIHSVNMHFVIVSGTLSKHACCIRYTENMHFVSDTLSKYACRTALLWKKTHIAFNTL